MKINYQYKIPYAEVCCFGFKKCNDLVDLTPYRDLILPYIPLVIKKLNENRETRQAVITLNKGVQSNDLNTCLISLQFQIYNNILYVTANFRSEHENLGLPYDKPMLLYIATIVKKGLKNIRYVDITCNVGNYHTTNG